MSVILIIRNYWRFLFLVMFKNTITDKDEWHSALVAVKPRALPENLQTNVGPECESPCHILLHWKSRRYTSSRKLKPSPLIKSSNIKWILTTVCDCNLSTGRFSLLTFHCQSSPPDDSGNFIYVQGNNLNHPMEAELSLWTGLFKWARISLVVFLGEEVLKNWSRTNTVTSLGMEVIAEGLPLVCYIFSEPKGCFGFSFQSKKAAVFTQKLSSNPQGWKMKPTEKTAVPQMATWGSL